MIGKIISHYKIIEKLGQGGMGVVYKAEDIRLDRLVAIKFLPPSLAASEEEKQRFIQEAKAASALDHTNICTVYDIDETKDGQMYIVLAYYEGETLRSRIQRSALDIPEAISIVLQIAGGLSKAHHKGIIHRDIKPANIIITPEGIAKLIDFGLAKLTAAGRITPSRSTLGTIAYMSPEQARAEEADQRSDIWSIGVMLYEMITGKLPFAGDIDIALIYSIVNEEPTPVRNRITDIDPALVTIINRCLEKDPVKRYQSAEQLMEELHHSISDAEKQGSVSTVYASQKTSILKRYWSWAAGLAFSFFILFYMFAGYKPLQKSAPAASLSDKVFAIFPFTVRGAPELSYLEEGIVDLLYINLNGAGELRAVDPRALLNRIKLLHKEKQEIEDASKIARFFSAGNYMVGSILAEKDQVRISAAIYNSKVDDKTSIPVTAQGRADGLFDLIDSMTGDILNKYSNEPSEQYERLSAATTQSIPALKAYMLGRKAERQGRFEEAYAFYSQATELDSCFALAWYGRGNINWGWLFNEQKAESELANAFRHSNRLKKHDRLFLDAYQKILQGDNERVIEIAREIVAENPDDIAGWDLLASWWWQTSVLFGRSITEQQAASNRLLELDPENVANYHSALIPALCRGELAEIDTLIAGLHRFGPTFPFTWSVEVPRAFLCDDMQLRQRLMAQAPLQSELCEMIGVSNMAINGRDVAEVIPYSRVLVDQPRSRWMEAFGFLVLATDEMSCGRWNAAMKKLDTLSTILPEYHHAFAGLFYPFTAYFSANRPTRQQIQEVQNWLPKARREPFGMEWDFVPLNNILPYIRWYCLGLLSHFSGDSYQANQCATELLKAIPPREAKSLLRLWAATIKSLQAMKEHRDAEALHILESEPIIIRYPLFSSPGYSIPFTRFLRAELLARNGRYQEALSWLAAFKGLYFFDVPYRAPAAWRMAQIYETLGEKEEAIKQYQKFLYMWRDCDAEFKPMIAEAEKHLAALK